MASPQKRSDCLTQKVFSNGGHKSEGSVLGLPEFKGFDVRRAGVLAHRARAEEYDHEAIDAISFKALLLAEVLPVIPGRGWVAAMKRATVLLPNARSRLRKDPRHAYGRAQAKGHILEAPENTASVVESHEK
jgi:hypothetical protein